ncbi:MAG TPA: hypothetical protein VFI57_10395 [Pyrinomonadaceae bacterium]|jgi:hypothetical protein|nr:hypothetical protein [Pyrinomonadaceae bacterium]
MKRFLLVAVMVFIGFDCHKVLRAQAPTAPDEKRATQPKKRGGIFTMYVHDPLARTMCFSDGKEGFAFVDNDWRNRCSDLSYVLASGGSLMSGIEVNRVAAIVDLGTPDELRQRYGFEEAQDGATGFASLHLNGDKIRILKQDLSKPEYQALREGPKLFTEVAPSATAPIKLGHIYLVRIADQKDTSFQQLVKLMVIAYRPEESVTLRWELL